MKNIDEFLEKLDSGHTYMMWSFPVGDTGKKVFKEEIIKDPYRVKAAKIIRELVRILNLCEPPGMFEVEESFIKIDKILNEEEGL